MTYNEFIDNINNKKIYKITFYVQDYNHYNNCSIKRYDCKTEIWGKEIFFDTVEVKLTNDTSEIYRFLEKFKEDFKLFKIGKQKYTLKQMWNKITITDIEYNSF